MRLTVAALQEGFNSLAVVLKHAAIFPDHEEAIGKLADKLGFSQVCCPKPLLVFCCGMLLCITGMPHVPTCIWRKANRATSGTRRMNLRLLLRTL